MAAVSLQRLLALVPRSPGEVKRTGAMLDSLAGLGWQRSVRERRPQRPDGEPLPWWTYAAITWLEPRLRPTDRAFEWGSGGSSRWFAARVASVLSIDHDAAWVAEVGRQAPANAEVRHAAGRAYVDAIPDDRFDVVVVDGIDRVACTERAVDRLTDTGIVVLDNSDRPDLVPALAALERAGFHRIDFLGPAVGSGRLSVTTVAGPDLRRWTAPHPPLPHVGY